MFPMNFINNFIGNLFFHHQQEWERQKNARIMFWTVMVALALALAVAAAIKMLNGMKH
jgi:hypothetical protein